MSIPISDTMTEAATAPTLGGVVNPWAASRKGECDPLAGSVLASQPTLSRFENAPGCRELLAAGRVMAGHRDTGAPEKRMGHEC